MIRLINALLMTLLAIIVLGMSGVIIGTGIVVMLNAANTVANIAGLLIAAVWLWIVLRSGYWLTKFITNYIERDIQV